MVRNRLTLKIYCMTIVSTCFNPKELKVSPKDQIYTMPSHWRMSDAWRRKDMQIHTDLKLSDPEIMLTTSNSVYATPESHRCSIRKVFQTRLLTLVQVGDWREYAREAIIKWLLSYSLFMINVYFTCYNCINTETLIHVCLINKQKVSSYASLIY